MFFFNSKGILTRFAATLFLRLNEKTKKNFRKLRKIKPGLRLPDSFKIKITDNI